MSKVGQILAFIAAPQDFFSIVLLLQIIKIKKANLPIF
jgi:hypothetical protein